MSGLAIFRRVFMTEVTQRVSEQEIDDRIARFLEHEEALEKAERKEARKAVLQPLGFLGAAIAVLGTSLSIYMPIINSSLAKDAAVAVEEWSTSHPAKDIPVTNGFVGYPSYLTSLGVDSAGIRETISSPIRDPENLMIKVIKDTGSTSSSGYTVCTYLVSQENDRLDTYDSSTGKPVDNSLKACS
jgi:hypothetical protein